MTDAPTGDRTQTPGKGGREPHGASLWAARAVDFVRFLAEGEDLPPRPAPFRTRASSGWLRELVRTDPFELPQRNPDESAGQPFIAWLMARDTLPPRPAAAASDRTVGWMSWLLGSEDLPSLRPSARNTQGGERGP